MNTIYSTQTTTRQQAALLALFTLCLFLPSNLRAQEYRATLLGRVVDAQGSSNPGAAVTVINKNTGVEYRSQTNESGDYAVPFLIPGEYTARIEKEGFRTFTSGALDLRIGDRITLDITLTLNSVASNITVSGSPSLLETSTGSRAEVLTTEQMNDIPLNGRNPFLLARLEPGAAPVGARNFVRPFDNGSTSDLSISGAPNRLNEVLLDGLTNVSGAYVIATTPPPDAIQEMRVQVNTYDAEYGRFAGGVLNLTTRSGTNRFHGSLYDYFQNDLLNANDFFSNRAGQPLPPLRYNQFGGTVSGPLVVPGIYKGKNRTFFFFDYDAIRQTNPRSASVTVPTLAQREGDFSSTLNQSGKQLLIYDPFSTRADPAHPGSYLRDPFPNNRIPSSQIDPVAARVLAFYPLPNSPGDPLTQANNYRYSVSPPSPYNEFLGRGDHNINDSQRLFGRLSWSKRVENGSNIFNSPATHAGAYRVTGGAMLDYTWTISPTLLLDVRGGITRYEEPSFDGSTGFDITDLGFSTDLRNRLPGSVFPGFSFPDYQKLGNGGNAPSYLDTQSYQANITYIHNAHTIKAGTDYRRYRQNIGTAAPVSGTYSFTSAFTQGADPLKPVAASGSSMASFLLGAAASASAGSATLLAFSSPYAGSYLEDSYKINERFTLNAGVRLDWAGGYRERYNRLTRGFAFDEKNPVQVPGYDLRGGLLFAGVGGLPDTQTDAAWSWAPRIGIAWRLNDKTTLRAGYGIFYSGTTQIGTGSPAALGYSVTTPFVTTIDGLTPVARLSNPFAGTLLQASGSSQGLKTLLGQSITFVNPDRAVPYTQQFSLTLGRQFGKSIVAEVSYSGSRGSHLPAPNRQWNQLPDQDLALGSQLLQQVANPFAGLTQTGILSKSTVAYGQLLRPYPLFDSVTELSPTVGNSTYHSLQSKFEKRFAGGFMILGSYTWSKLIDDVGAPQNYNNLRAERELATIDRTHRFVASGAWDLPMGKGQRLFRNAPGPINRLVSGWQIASILTFQSGVPLSLTVTPNTTNSLGGNERPNSTGVSAQLDGSDKTSTLARYFNVDAFTQPAPFTFGNISSSLPDVRGPGTANLDVTVSWNVPILERLKLQLRGEAYNALNRTEFAAPGTTFGTAQFGVVSATANSSNPARILQVSAKVTF